MNEPSVFDIYTNEYEEWFEKNKFAYLTELEAIRRALPPHPGRGLEIGVGTGRFAQPLGIEVGIDPSDKMLEIARKRGIKAVKGEGENLPFKDEEFDFVLLAFTLCFVKDPKRVLQEAQRVLKPNGLILIGIIDRESELGKLYLSRKNESKFYRIATFFSTQEIMDMLQELGFKNIRTLQTLFGNPTEL
ncbi:methyltransferase domain-containing protein, partial [bacterium]|nr:methyltransferase domain-containing protein [bacterium]